MFTIIAAIAQLEREMIAEKVRNGLINARAKGKRLGRPTSVDRTIVKALVKQKLSYREIAKLTGASHWIIREVIKEVMRSETNSTVQNVAVGKQMFPSTTLSKLIKKIVRRNHLRNQLFLLFH